MRCALFEPGCGYYAADRVRVGRARGTDFYTATSLGPVFGGLVAECCATLAAPLGIARERLRFVELGAEPSGGVLEGVAHGFASAEALGLSAGDPLEARLGKLAERGPVAVFSNELFDAQPVERWVRRDGRWREAGVRVPMDPEGMPEWTFTERASPAWLEAEPGLAAAPEGWTIDAPRAAVSLLERLAAVKWTGVFVAFDYGLPWAAVACERPEGTLRAYRAHALEKDLLARPGEQDLTAHVCWDWLESALGAAGFRGVQVQAQESFLVRHGAARLRELAAEIARSPFGPEARKLQELLHPARMGSKFQVLHGVRG
jgi:SAM-dependent MidA family methyltransferase